MELMEYEQLWKEELLSTDKALRELVKILGDRKLPRIRAPQVFIGPYQWPDRTSDGLCYVWRQKYDIPLPGGYRSRVSLTEIPIGEVAKTPSELHRAIKRVRWIRRWCLARIDGIRRAEAELLRQQKSHVEWLARERAAQELAR